jgi:hypothetical protein
VPALASTTKRTLLAVAGAIVAASVIWLLVDLRRGSHDDPPPVHVATPAVSPPETTTPTPTVAPRPMLTPVNPAQPSPPATIMMRPATAPAPTPTPVAMPATASRPDDGRPVTRRPPD